MAGNECYEPQPRKPRLIWSGRDKRSIADALPSQVIEIVFPQHAQVKDLRAWNELRRVEAQQAQLPGMRPPSQLGFAPENGRTDLLPANRLIWTNDNLVALTSLLHGDDQHPPLEGKVDLIYIDPPFAVQSDFKINVEIENGVEDEKLPTLIEELAYTDTWKDGLDSYLSMMRDRLELLERLLAPNGSIFVHCDWHVNYLLRMLLDEIFGRERFLNEIVWHYYNKFQGNVNRFASDHDTILWYTKSESYQFEPLKEKRAEGSVKQIKRVWNKELGRIVNQKDEHGKVVYQETDEKTVDDVWRMSMLQPADRTEKTAFPTQKPLALLQRIIAAASLPGDLVLDAFAGSGTAVVAAETMKDSNGKPAPRRWIAMDCGKFAIHISRKRLIEAGAQPFAVENIGFYARGREWKDLWAERPEIKVYRDAMVEMYGGTPVDGFAYLHGRKGSRWIHIGPIDAPIATSQVEAVLAEAAGTDLKAVDILSADIPIDWNPGEAESRYGVKVYPKIIPAAAIEAIRDRLSRRRRKDGSLEEASPVHFFSPPDIEVGLRVARDTITVTLLRLTVDLEDSLSTQDPVKRAKIKERITDWRALVDYWAVDWDYREGEPFQNDWQSFRTRKSPTIATQATHSYGNVRGEKLVAVKVTDVFGNDGLKVARITVG